jgi:nitrous oxidase accessory protein NosD
MKNNFVGIHCCCGANSNYFYNNTLFNNSARNARVDSDVFNIWYNYPNGTGNYWDDYYGPDNNGDGIGEVSYTVGGVNDRYPLGVFQQPPTVSSPSPSHLATGISRQPTLKVKVTDPEKSGLLLISFMCSKIFHI